MADNNTPIIPESGINQTPNLYVVVPCFNEEEMLPLTAQKLFSKLRDLKEKGIVSAESRILFADDGSIDRTWEIICSLHDNPAYDHVFTGISLAHNRGHQNVLYAGLMCALNRGCDAAVSMDADLQDDPDAIEEMLSKYVAGANIVFGVRESRETDTRLKRGTAHAFYSLMGALGTETVPDSADYRLMDIRSLEALSQYGESNLFLRGIVASLGFKTARVYYRRAERLEGVSKYPLRKMVSFALDGITSFSVTPLRCVTVAGAIFVLVAIASLAYALISLASGVAVGGWTSLLVSIWFVGGSVMLSLGVVGEYVGKIYIETKHRPRYYVAEELS